MVDGVAIPQITSIEVVPEDAPNVVVVNRLSPQRNRSLVFLKMPIGFMAIHINMTRLAMLVQRRKYGFIAEIISGLIKLLTAT